MLLLSILSPYPTQMKEHGAEDRGISVSLHT